MKIFKKLLDRVLELVGKKEQPKAPIESEEKVEEVDNNIVKDDVEEEKPFEIPQPILLRLKEIEAKYTSKMNINRDIIAYFYVFEQDTEYRKVAAIFNVAASTVHRRVRDLPKKLMVMFNTIKEEFSLSDNEVLEIFRDYFGPEFVLDESGELKFFTK